MASQTPNQLEMTLPLSTDPEEVTHSGASTLTGSKEKFEEPQRVKSGEIDIVESSGTLMKCLQVVGAFFLMFNSWGIANTFGVFQTYYESDLLSSQTPSQISWIGSIQAFLLLVVGGLITGPIFDAGYLRGLVLFGSIVNVFGMMMTSICTKYWQIVICQGVIMGIGSGCMLLPSVAVMPQYFTNRRAFATGIAAAGSSVGGVIYPIVFHKLQPRVGFGWAARTIGFIMLGTLLVPIFVMRAKVFPSTRRPLFDTKILHYMPFNLFSIGAFFGYMGMYIPFYYISTFTSEHHYSSVDLSFYMLTILNASSVFGRLIPNFFADTIGPLNISTPFIGLCGVIAFCWLSIHNLGGIIVFCIFYGFFSGTFVSITGPALATLSPELSLVGTHMGMSFGFGAFGLLIGNPIAGVLLDGYGWIGPICWCGACNILAAACIFVARIKKTGWVIWIKA